MRHPGPILLLALLGCGEPSTSPPPGPTRGPVEGSPNARPEILENFREDLAAPRHPSDGGGRAWLDDPQEAVVATPGRWTIVYEVGELGVAEGGAVYLQVSPF